MLSSIPSCACTAVWFFIHLLMNIWFVSSEYSEYSTIVNKSVVNITVQVFWGTNVFSWANNLECNQWVIGYVHFELLIYPHQQYRKGPVAYLMNSIFFKAYICSLGALYFGHVIFSYLFMRRGSKNRLRVFCQFCSVGLKLLWKGTILGHPLSMIEESEYNYKH